MGLRTTTKISNTHINKNTAATSTCTTRRPLRHAAVRGKYHKAKYFRWWNVFDDIV